MPTTPNGLPYPASTAAPNVPADLQALALALDRIAKTPKLAAGIVPFTFASEITKTALVTFPTTPTARFTTPPSVNVTCSGSSVFVGYIVSTATAASVTIGLITRAGTASSGSVSAQWIAAEQAINQP